MATAQQASLASASRYYTAQQEINALAVRSLRTATSAEQATQVTSAYQTAAAALAMQAVAAQVAEQGIDAPPTALLDLAAFTGITGAGADLLAYLSQASSIDDLVFMGVQAIRDAGRTAHGVATVARPNLTGHIRYLNPPSCSRCVLLAGRFYRWSEGFARHENCDCVMIAVGDDVPDGLRVNPDQAWRDGWVSDLTAAEMQALEDGADLGQVVNVRRKSAGLRVAGRILSREGGRTGRLTPEGIYQLASDRAEAVGLLRRFGYLR